jgi:hypothetical protein
MEDVSANQKSWWANIPNSLPCDVTNARCIEFQAEGGTMLLVYNIARRCMNIRLETGDMGISFLHFSPCSAFWLRAEKAKPTARWERKTTGLERKDSWVARIWRPGFFVRMYC